MSWGFLSRVRCVGWLVFTQAGGQAVLGAGVHAMLEGKVSCMLFGQLLRNLLLESLAVSVLG